MVYDYPVWRNSNRILHLDFCNSLGFHVYKDFSVFFYISAIAVVNYTAKNMVGVITKIVVYVIEDDRFLLTWNSF